MKLYPLIVLMLVVFSCDRNRENKTSTKHEVTSYSADIDKYLKPSIVQIPIDYPVRDLQRMVNRLLPDTLVHERLAINNKGDSLILKIVPLGQLTLNAYANNLDTSIPVMALVNLQKKVIGLNFKNVKPVELKLRIDLHNTLTLNENYDLNAQCKIQKIQWIEEPNVKIAGIKIKLDKIVNKQLEENGPKIESLISQVIEKLVPIRKEVDVIWSLLNTPHRVAKRPVEIWLTTVPSHFSAKISEVGKDTIRAFVHVKTKLFISPLRGLISKNLKELPANKKFKTDPKLETWVAIHMPYTYVDKILFDQLKDQTISYSGLSASLSDFKSSSEANRLRLEFSTIGEIDMMVKTLVKPTLSNQMELELEDLDYSLESDNPIVTSIDWLSNGTIDQFLIENTKIPLVNILDSLDTKIMSAMQRSKLGSKIALDLSFHHIQEDTILFYKDRFDWVFSVDGEASAKLNDQLVAD